MCEQFPKEGNVGGEILRKCPPLPFSEVREGWIIRERAVGKRGESVRLVFKTGGRGCQKD